jgi:hypothetical protein
VQHFRADVNSVGLLVRLGIEGVTSYTTEVPSPGFGGGGMKGHVLVDGVEARRQPLCEFGRVVGVPETILTLRGACHFVVHEKTGFRATSGSQLPKT